MGASGVLTGTALSEMAPSELEDVLSRAPAGWHLSGEWRAARHGSLFGVTDPASAREIATVADCSPDDAVDAVAAAHEALHTWRAHTPRERSEILRRAWKLMIEHRDTLADLIVIENGKARADALAEVDYAAEFFRWFAEEAVRVLGSVGNAPNGSNRMLVTHEPIGVSVLVTPWNFPAAMATRKIGPALAAGCTTVLKPASETPLTALAVAGIMERAGTPPGVVNVLPSRRSAAVVSAMLHDTRVRKLSFTGSTEVGRQLLHEAADQVVSSAMELGGNAPFLVFADADLDAAVDGAMIAKMRNGGEACTAANRFLVETPVAEEFGQRLADRMGALVCGPGRTPDVEVGPLVNADTRDKVDKLVRDAVADGARVLTGGKRPTGDGYFYPPTVVTGLRPDAALLNSEIFGPVAPIVAFDSEAEAVALANSTEYGLVAYVYTADLGRGLRVAESIEAGMVGLNRGLVSDPAAPFGGVKQSGIGREGGHDGLLEYLESKYIAVSW